MKRTARYGKVFEEAPSNAVGAYPNEPGLKGPEPVLGLLYRQGDQPSKKMAKTMMVDKKPKRRVSLGKVRED